jgi:hypothetical protein
MKNIGIFSAFGNHRPSAGSCKFFQSDHVMHMTWSRGFCGWAVRPPDS